jgi:hypothetical protein
LFFCGIDDKDIVGTLNGRVNALFFRNELDGVSEGGSSLHAGHDGGKGSGRADEGSEDSELEHGEVYYVERRRERNCVCVGVWNRGFFLMFVWMTYDVTRNRRKTTTAHLALSHLIVVVSAKGVSVTYVSFQERYEKILPAGARSHRRHGLFTRDTMCVSLRREMRR